MTPERLSKIIAVVQEKYVGRSLNNMTVGDLYKDMSAVVRGLHKSEHFLNFSVDHRQKMILVKDTETMNYLGLMPYLDNSLMTTNEVYCVYLLKGMEAHTQCAVQFIDLYNGSTTESYIGFDVKVSPIVPLGLYYPDNNEFRRWRYE